VQSRTKKEDEDPLKGMQQAEGYSECERFDAKYIFSTNGHRYAQFCKFDGGQTGPFPFADFPEHQLRQSSGLRISNPVWPGLVCTSKQLIEWLLHAQFHCFSAKALPQ
jgi:hypothetical protein